MMEREFGPHTVRTRIAHTYTKTSGWKHETTVELVSNALDATDHERALAMYLRQADDLGRQEARSRNIIDGVSVEQAA